MKANDFTILRNGEKEKRVQRLQIVLLKEGLYKGRVDGVFGPETSNAVKEFQKKMNMQADGMVGPQLWEYIIKKYDENPAAESVPAEEGMEKISSGDVGPFSAEHSMHSEESAPAQERRSAEPSRQDENQTQPSNDPRFSESMREVYKSIGAGKPVTASFVVEAIARTHQRYAGNRAGTLKLDTALGNSQPIEAWFSKVGSFYPFEMVAKSKHEVIDGRLMILGLSRLDQEFAAQPEMHGFLKELEKEIDPEIKKFLDEQQISDGGVKAAAAETATAHEGVRAGYFADSVPMDSVLGDDKLGIAHDVNTLASVLADDGIEPPLAVGLFGDWGSGKSFFMGQLRKRIRLLADAALEAEKQGKKPFYCSHIRQITFNAWHYCDATLWASLITHIFEGLASAAPEDVEKGDEAARANAEVEAEKILKELHSTKELKRVLDSTREDGKKLEEGIKQVRELFGQRSAREELKKLKGPLAREGLEELNKLKDQFGIKDDPTVKDIQTFVNDMHHIGRFCLKIWQHMGNGRRSLCIALILAFFAGVTWLDTIANIHMGIIGRMIGAILVWVAGVIPLIKEPVSQLRKITERAEQIWDNLNQQQTDEEAKLERERARVEERVRELEGQLEDLKPGRRLARLIAERAACDEYRSQLGITAMIRQDFQDMSDLLRRSRKERTSSDKMDGNIPRIDRIILYIDDLDRCSADHVVEVLEAVHLLLAFPLFVVVVGVDPRWLLRSLEKHYSGLLTAPDGSPDGYLTHPDMDADWDATPMNYLEKIFQIPFTLLPMDPNGYKNLLEYLVPIRLTEEEHRQRLEKLKDLLGRARLLIEDPSLAESESFRKKWEAMSPEQKNEVIEKAEQDGREFSYKKSLANISVEPQSLTIEREELEFMKLVGPLLDTPRAAKRLTNIYRLLRASLNDAELKELINLETKTGDYPAVIVLLGIVVGFPHLANAVFEKIHSSKNDDLWKDLMEGLRPHDAEGRAAPDARVADDKTGPPLRSMATSHLTPDEARLWHRLHMRIRRVEEDTRGLLPSKLGPYRRWIFRVARYSFHTGRLVVSGERSR